MKVALAYISTTPELIELVEKEVGVVLPVDMEVASYQDLSILAEVRDAGYATAPPAARLAGTYMKAVTEGVDAILNLYSSVGEVVDVAQDIGKLTGIPIVRVDEEMYKETMRQGRRTGVMATLPATLNPTKNTILRVVREMNRRVELADALVDGVLGLDQEQLKTLISRYVGETADQMDVILLTQGSMVYCEEYIHGKYGKVVLSSPRFGAVTLRDALVRKGLL